MKLWLDDIRVAPDGWTWVKTVPEAISAMLTGSVTAASLDHDLGENQPEGRSLVLWMAENNVWPSERIAFHTANPVGRQYMLGVAQRYAPPSLEIRR